MFWIFRKFIKSKLFDQHLLLSTLAYLQARSSESNKLELHFRPEDPYSHPAFGELYPCNNFLLKISKKEEGEGRSVSDANEKSNCSSSYTIYQDQKISCPESIETGYLSQPGSELVPASANVEIQIPNKVQENLYADVIAQVSESYQFNG